MCGVFRIANASGVPILAMGHSPLPQGGDTCFHARREPHRAVLVTEGQTMPHVSEDALCVATSPIRGFLLTITLGIVC